MKYRLANHPLVSLLVIVSVLLSSCAKEGIEVSEQSSSIQFPVPKIIIETSFFGRVLDSNDQAIVGATVTCLSCLTELTTETDTTGNFLFNKIKHKGTKAFVTVQYPDMFDGFRRFSVQSNKYSYTEIRLNAKVLLGTLDSNLGGALVDPNNSSSVFLPADGIVDALGNSYSGPVDVYSAWIDPSATDLAQNMIGDLSGIDSQGGLVALSTFGMLVVELQDPNGNELNIGEGFKAELKFPVPASLLNRAPEAIPLWYYDEENGYWLEEGQAFLDGEFYVGTVTHFSAWNVDAKTEDVISIFGFVTLETNTRNFGASYYKVFICGDNIGQIGGWLCDDGSFEFYNLPLGEVITLKVIDHCDQVVYEKILGAPPATTFILPIVIQTIANSSALVVSGNANDCNLMPVQNGLAVLKLDGRTYYQNINADGTFEFLVSACEGFNGYLYIMNRENFTKSNTIDISSFDTDFDYKDVFVCDELDEYFYYKLDGYREDLILREFLFSMSFLPDLVFPNSRLEIIATATDFNPNNPSLAIDIHPDSIIENQIMRSDSTFRIRGKYEDDGDIKQISGTMENIELLFTSFSFGSGLENQYATGQLNGFFIDDDEGRIDVTASFKFMQHLE